MPQYYLNGSKYPMSKLATLFYLKLMNTTLGRFGILELQNWVTSRATRLIVMHNLIFLSQFTNLKSTEKFSIYVKLKGNIKKASVITKGQKQLPEVLCKKGVLRNFP